MSSYGSEWCNEWATVEAASIPPSPSLALFRVSRCGSLKFWALFVSKVLQLWFSLENCPWLLRQLFLHVKRVQMLEAFPTLCDPEASCFHASCGDNKYMLDCKVFLQDPSPLPCASHWKHFHSKSLQKTSHLRIWPKTDSCYTFMWTFSVGYLSLKFLVEIWAGDIYVRTVGLWCCIKSRGWVRSRGDWVYIKKKTTTLRI